MGSIGILLADDDLLVRSGLQALLEIEPEFEVVCVAGSLDELLDGVEECSPSVVITDIRMRPDFSDEGIRAAQILRDRHPAIGVVVLSQFVEASYALAMMDHGSQGRANLLKEHVTEVGYLFSAVRAVAGGDTYIDRIVIDALLARNARTPRSVLEGLTARELEVLAEMGTGKSNAAIAQASYVGERAVEKHINSIFLKLGLQEDAAMNRRVKAVLLFLAHGSDQSGASTTANPPGGLPS